jgi:hypothetical protein
MGTYNFKDDLKVAQKTEVFIGKLLEKNGATGISFNRDGRYDIIAKINGKVIAFEIKEDMVVGFTGNVAVEFESRGKPSGIDHTLADFYIYVLHMKDCIVQYRMFSVKTLRKIIEEQKYFRIVIGGDEGSNTKMYLFKADVFLNSGKLIHQIGGTNAE